MQQRDNSTWLQDFVYQIGNPPGEKSYMRETIAYQVLG